LFSYYKGRKHFASLSNINCQGWKLLPVKGGYMRNLPKATKQEMTTFA
jgi:hypothetical protein